MPGCRAYNLETRVIRVRSPKGEGHESRPDPLAAEHSPPARPFRGDRRSACADRPRGQVSHTRRSALTSRSLSEGPVGAHRRVGRLCSPWLLAARHFATTSWPLASGNRVCSWRRGCSFSSLSPQGLGLGRPFTVDERPRACARGRQRRRRADRSRASRPFRRCDAFAVVRRYPGCPPACVRTASRSSCSA